MDEKIKELRLSLANLLGNDCHEQCYIELADGNEFVVSANRAGLLLIAEKIIEVCQKGQPSAHFHLDEAGMADKCDKPLIVQFINPP